MTGKKRPMTRIERKLSILFRELYTNTDCQTKFDVGTVCDFLRDCYSFQGSDAEQGDKIVALTEREDEI